MELEARITVLEDEVGILKGEIKTVLLEIRTAFLAQSNPFTNPSAHQVSLSQPAASVMMPPPTPAPVQTLEPDNIFKPEPVKPQAAATPREAAPVYSETSVIARQEPNQTRFEMHTLAMLMAWTQGNMARLNVPEMESLLALARYGGVIESELEVILLNMANHFEHELDSRTGKHLPKKAATISEYLLALHELNTVVNEEDEPSFRWLRKIA